MSGLRGSEHFQFSVSSDEVFEHTSTQKIFDEFTVIFGVFFRITDEFSFDLKSWDPGVLRKILLNEIFPWAEYCVIIFEKDTTLLARVFLPVWGLAPTAAVSSLSLQGGLLSELTVHCEA